jgi:hypothetical protein
MALSSLALWVFSPVPRLGDVQMGISLSPPSPQSGIGHSFLTLQIAGGITG